jgi:hypothetical protein
MKTPSSRAVIQTAKQAAKSAGVRLYSREGLALAVSLLKKGAAHGVAAPAPAPFLRERAPQKNR